MRLSNRIVSIIKRAVKSSFGNVDVYLFGSRVDDEKVGGDIDIAIDSDIPRDEFKKKKIQFITSMFRLGYDLKIDIVQYKNDDTLFSTELNTHNIKIA